GLDETDRSWENAQHAPVRAGWDHPWRWRFRVQASIAGAFVRPENGGLTFKTEDTAINVRLMQEDAGVVHKIARGEIVRSVNDDVVGFENVHHVFRGEFGPMRDHFNIRVDGRNAVLCRFNLRSSDVGGPKGHLTLEVREVRHVKVHQA